MDDDQLEISRSCLLAKLRSEADRPQLGNLPKFVTRGETLVLEYLAARSPEVVSILAKCDLVAGGQLVKGSSGERFDFALTESSPLHTECRFDVIPLNIDSKKLKLIRRSASVKSPGRFKRFAVSLPASLADAVTSVVEHGQLILDTGYAWIADQVLAFTDARELHIADGLYSLAREIFPEVRYRRELWFATVGPLYGFRLIAPDVVDGALSIYTEGAHDLPLSPVDLLAQLLASCLPRNLLLMDVAARRHGAMDVDISNAGYAKDPYAFVMAGLYKSTSFTIYPLLTRNDLSVMALFPTGRSTILSRLEAHEQEFSIRARDMAAAIYEAASLFEVVEQTDTPPAQSIERPNVAHLLGQAVDSARAESNRKRIAGNFRLRFPGRAK